MKLVLKILLGLSLVGLLGCSKEEAAKLLNGSSSSGLTEIQLPTTVDAKVGETLSFSDGEAKATLLQIGVKQDFCPQYSGIINDCSTELDKAAVLIRIQSVYGADVKVPLVLRETVTSSWGFKMTLNSVSTDSANITITN